MTGQFEPQGPETAAPVHAPVTVPSYPYRCYSCTRQIGAGWDKEFCAALHFCGGYVFCTQCLEQFAVWALEHGGSTVWQWVWTRIERWGNGLNYNEER